MTGRYGSTDFPWWLFIAVILLVAVIHPLAVKYLWWRFKLKSRKLGE